MSAIHLSEFKEHLNITGATNDGELQEILDAAEGWVRQFIGVELGAGSRTFRVRSNTGALVLSADDLAGITSVTDGEGVAVAVDDYDADLDAGIVYVPRRYRGTWTVVATFDMAIPADVRLATLIIGAHLWETQRGAAPSPIAMQDPVGDAQGYAGMGYAIPNRARALLEPHARPAIA